MNRRVTGEHILWQGVWLTDRGDGWPVASGRGQEHRTPTVPLGEGSTGEDGSYTISYSTAPIQKANKVRRISR